jgi:hypothetical protein
MTCNDNQICPLQTLVKGTRVEHHTVTLARMLHYLTDARVIDPDAYHASAVGTD